MMEPGIRLLLLTAALATYVAGLWNVQGWRFWSIYVGTILLCTLATYAGK